MPKTILIVDDDEMVRIALKELLGPEGYKVYSAASASEALEKVDEVNYDLLILDIIMPEMNGLELCKRIRQKKDYNEKPVVFLTAKSLDQDKIQGLEAGANLFLSKPISPEKLLHIVSETIG